LVWNKEDINEEVEFLTRNADDIHLTKW
jgi:hypothetical protein